MKQFRVYKSSAGSGKTTTLVNEYLRICLPNPDKFKHVIALTFTIKATNEMKQRVIETLHKIIHSETLMEDKKLRYTLNYLRENTKLSDANMVINAEILLKQIIHNYSQFTFSTLDSFVVNIVKSFAFELKLPASFDIELDQKILIDKALEMLFSEVGKDKLLTEYLVQYILQQVEDEASFNIANSLSELSELLFMASDIEYIKSLDGISLKDFTETSGILKTEIKKLEDTFKSAGRKALEIIHNSGLNQEDFIYGQTGIYGIFTKLIQGKTEIFGPRINKILESGIWYKKGISASTIQIFEEIIPVLSQIIYDIQKVIIEFVSLNLLNEKIVPLALLCVIKKNIDQIIKEEGLVHLSEMNNRISEIVMNEPIPFIFERIGKKYNHFLLDEFQDTSVIQWNNLTPLIENSLSSGNFNMVVGDAKQAIYRWRNGDVHQFVELPKLKDADKSTILKNRETVLLHNYEEKNLISNYRSSAKIVEFNNLVFGNFKSTIDRNSQKIYMNHEQEIGQKDKKSFIRVELLEKIEKQNTPFLQAILKNVETAIQHGFSAGDIAILARKNEIIKEIADFLSYNGYKIVTNKALSLNQSQKVRFVINLLKWIVTPSDKMLIAELLSNYALLKNISIENSTTFSIIHTQENSLESFFKAYGIEINQHELRSLPLTELVFYLLKIFDLNAQKDQFLFAFLDTLVEYTNQGGTGIINYLNRWEDKYKRTSLETSAVDDSIQLMSIHKSKGLEFPVVINALYGFNQRKGNDYFWTDIHFIQLPIKQSIVKNKKELLESYFKDLYQSESIEAELDNTNLLYVASTRPEYESYFVIDQNAKELENFIQSIQQSCKHMEFLQIEPTKFESNYEPYNFETKSEAQNSKQVLNSEFSLANCITPTQKTAAVFHYNPEVQKRIDFGIIAHTLFSYLDDFDKMYNFIEKCKNLDYPKQEIEKLVKISDQIRENNEINLFFKDKIKVYSEKNILLKDGKTVRPDKVIIKKDRIIIIDLKTSSYSEIQEEILQKYCDQVKEYANILNKMYQKPIEMYLLFTENDLFLYKVEMN